MQAAHSIQIRFTRLELVNATYTSNITPEELSQLRACATRDEQLLLIEEIGRGDGFNHMVANAEELESIVALTDLTSDSGETDELIIREFTTAESLQDRMQGLLNELNDLAARALQIKGDTSDICQRAALRSALQHVQSVINGIEDSDLAVAA